MYLLADTSTTTRCLFFFFFQAEDGIRDLTVTGVHALPITAPARGGADRALRAPGGGADPLRALRLALVAQALEAEALALPAPIKSRPAHARAARGCACQLFTAPAVIHARSEERRVGKECR